MRTTLTLENDVAEGLRQATASGKISLKQAVNETLRVGLGLRPAKVQTPFRVKTHRSEYCPGVDRGRFNQLVDELEADAFAGKRG
jgi:hypothetical protein